MFPPSWISHPPPTSRLLQSPSLSSLSHTTNSHWLSILYMGSILAPSSPLPSHVTRWFLNCSVQSYYQEYWWNVGTFDIQTLGMTQMICWCLWLRSLVLLLLVPYTRAHTHTHSHTHTLSFSLSLSPSPSSGPSQPEKWPHNNKLWHGLTRDKATKKPVASGICRPDPLPAFHGILTAYFTAPSPPLDSWLRIPGSPEPTVEMEFCLGLPRLPSSTTDWVA